MDINNPIINTALITSIDNLKKDYSTENEKIFFKELVNESIILIKNLVTNYYNDHSMYYVYLVNFARDVVYGISTKNNKKKTIEPIEGVDHKTKKSTKQSGAGADP